MKFSRPIVFTDSTSWRMINRTGTGAVLGVILGLANGHAADELFKGLRDRQAIDAEISVLLAQ